MATAAYSLVRLRNGAHAVRTASYDQVMHPGLGPAAEAEALYVRQLRIRERMRHHDGEFVVWDVGLGAAANALTLLWLTRDLVCPLRLVSFDDASGALEFALANTEQLGYFHGYQETVQELLGQRGIAFRDGARPVRWDFHLGDFPSLLAHSLTHSPAHPLPPPHAIFFDAFSPAKNPAMWTLPLFTNLFRLLEPARACSLTTYSRSTMLRVTLLLAGFFVGRGIPAGLKEETTVAANARSLLEAPLGCKWLESVHHSGSAEPLHEPAYAQSRLAESTWQKLRAHPQFHH